MWNFLDDLKNWYIEILNSNNTNKYALSYVNEEHDIKIPFLFVEEILQVYFGTNDILEDTRNELSNLRLFNELLIEKLNALKTEWSRNNNGQRKSRQNLQM